MDWKVKQQNAGIASETEQENGVRGQETKEMLMTYFFRKHKNSECQHMINFCVYEVGIGNPLRFSKVFKNIINEEAHHFITTGEI